MSNAIQKNREVDLHNCVIPHQKTFIPKSIVELTFTYLATGDWVNCTTVCKAWYESMQAKRTLCHVKNKEVAEEYLFPKLWDDSKWFTSIIRYSQVQVKIYLDISQSMSDPALAGVEGTPIQFASSVIQRIASKCFCFTSSFELVPFSSGHLQSQVVNQQTNLKMILDLIECTNGTDLDNVIANINSEFPNDVEIDQQQKYKKFYLISDMDISDPSASSFISVLRNINGIATANFELVNVGPSNHPKGKIMAMVIDAIDQNLLTNVVCKNATPGTPVAKKQKTKT